MEDLVRGHFLAEALGVGIVLRLFAEEFHDFGARHGREIPRMFVHVGLDDLGIALRGVRPERPLKPRIPRITDGLNHSRRVAFGFKIVTIERLFHAQDEHQIVLSTGNHVAGRQHGIGAGSAAICYPHQRLVLKPNNPLQSTLGNCLELKDVVVDSRHAGLDFLDVDARVANRLTDRHLSQFPKSFLNPPRTAWGHTCAYYGYIPHWIAPDLFIYSA